MQINFLWYSPIQFFIKAFKPELRHGNLKIDAVLKRETALERK